MVVEQCNKPAGDARSFGTKMAVMADCTPSMADFPNFQASYNRRKKLPVFKPKHHHTTDDRDY